MPKRDLLGDTGGVGQQVSDCGGTQLVFAGDQLVGVKMVVGGRIELDESLLLQLHYGDRGEGLGDGGDSKEVSSARGLFDARSARPCPWKDSSDPLRTTSSAKPGGRLAIEDLVDPGPHLEPVDIDHGALLSGWRRHGVC
jgi:hypothetical protein